MDNRITAFSILFEELQDTNSRNEKELIVASFKRHYPEYREDLEYIFETLAGKHPIGWTFSPKLTHSTSNEFSSIKQMIETCLNAGSHSVTDTAWIEGRLGGYGLFIEPIVNRTLKLGISQVEKTILTPMLAKKYEGGVLNSDVFVTEKLDGNRCIASFQDGIWRFTSRSGKPMNVNFNMDNMDRGLIYDGEILSDAQTELSVKRAASTDFKIDTKDTQLLFNTTSGLINRLGNKTGLVYNIFDVVYDSPYIERRFDILDTLAPRTDDVRILPLLYSGSDVSIIDNLLEEMLKTGGEGLMLNLPGRRYEHKRTDALLKYKKVQSMDMQVIDTLAGKGKYDGMVGALQCYIKLEDGREVLCDVGSGLTDTEREIWSYRPQHIIGRIVQIGYHEMTQDSASIGTNRYSLRFPRLLKVRPDKDSTSEF